MSQVNVTITPGALPPDGTPVTNSTLRQIAQPTGYADIQLPNEILNILRNGNFLRSRWNQNVIGTGISNSTTNASTVIGVDNPHDWHVQGETISGLAGTATLTAVANGSVPNTQSIISLEVDATSADFSIISLLQQIPADVIGPFAGQEVTFSVYVENVESASFVPNLSLYTPNNVDNFSATTLQSSTAIQSCPNGQWTQISLTLQLPSQVSNGLQLQIDLPTGALTAQSGNTVTFRFSQIMLQPGSVLNAFQSDPDLTRDYGLYLPQPWLQNHPQNQPLLPTTYDDEFNTSYIQSKWTVTSSGAGNAMSQAGGRLSAVLAASGYVQAIQSFTLVSGTAFEFEVCTDQSLWAPLAGSSAAWAYIGLVGSSKSFCLVLGVNEDTTNVQGPILSGSRGTQTTGGTLISASENFPSILPRFVKFGYDGTNIYLKVSADGFTWFTFDSENYASGLSFGGAAVTGIVLGAYTGAGTYNGHISFDFIRKTI